MKVNNYWITGFAVVATCVLISEIIKNDTINMVSKSLIIPSLLAYAWASGIMQNRGIATLTFLALLFSWSGDILLLFQEENKKYFLFGLASFLVAHIFYIADYAKAKRDYRNTRNLKEQMFAAILIILFVVGLLTLIYPNLNEMKIPVIIYALVISLMLWSSIIRRGHTSQISFRLVFIGSIFFILSDSMLALNKFWQPLPVSGFLIMSTYMLAQYLIVLGLLKHISSSSS